MSERFERLYKLPDNLYTNESPIIISAGALLKDNDTGSVVVQLKFQSVSPKSIKAVKISLSAYDVSGAEIQGAQDFQYLDLNIYNGQDFGSNRAIIMPAAVTRRVSVQSVTVVFSDESSWKNTHAYCPLPTSSSLEQHFGDSELVKQYHLCTNDAAIVAPVEEGSLWRCSCGVWNSGNSCTNCRISKGTVFSKLDVTFLADQKTARLAEEKRQREEYNKALELQKAQAAASKRKIRKITTKAIAIALSCFAVLFAAVYVVRNVIVPSIVYNDAVELIGQEKYLEAYYRLHKCRGYKDTEDVLNNFILVYEKSTYTFSDGKTSVTDYIYDEEGRCTSEKTLNSSGSISSFEYQYDEAGNLLKEIENMSDGRVFITEFIYGNYGCIKEEHSSLHQDYKYTTEYEYDDGGRCIKEITTDSDGDVDTVDYHYDSAGNLLKAYYSRSWGGDAFIEYFYDSESMCVEERHWFAQDETPYETVEYVRNGTGEWTVRVSKDRGGNVEKTMQNFYDDYGNRYKYTITDSEGSTDTNEFSGLVIFYNNG